MRTEIQPELVDVPGTGVGDMDLIQEYGFYVGSIFVAMRPHKGYVDLTYSQTGRPRFLKGGNHKRGQRLLKYRGNRTKLVVLSTDKIPENTIEILVKSQGQALVVLPSPKPEVNITEESVCLQ